MALVRESPAPRASVPALLAAGAVFAVCWAATCLLLDRVYGARTELPLGESSVLRAGLLSPLKDAYWRAHAGEIDLLFLGSSRVYRQIDATLFDQTLAERGVAVSSFNYGVPGMLLPETLSTVDRILARRPERLRWLVLELQDVDPELHEENFLSRRQIDWHTPRVTAEMLRVVLHSERSPEEKADAASLHLVHFLYRFANLDRGLPALATALGYRRVDVPAVFAMDGFVPLEREARADPELEERHELFLRTEAPEVPERRRGLAAALDRPGREDPVAVGIVRALAERVRAAGIEPLFVIVPPCWEPLTGYRLAAERGEIPNLLSYNDPREHPAYYEVENLYGLAHLNQRGAELFTRRLALDVASALGLLEPAPDPRAASGAPTRGDGGR